MKNKKIYAIPIFIFVIVITYGISLAEIEAPKPSIEKIEEIKLAEKIASNDDEKYVIISRSVVAPKNILNKNKIVLLTIDDGPSVRTKDMMAILKNHNAKAIFFINGMNDKYRPGVIEEIAKEGFYVGNHTWSHLNLKKQNDDSIINKEINKNSELIKKLTGTPSLFFRAPFGESNPHIRKIVKDDGMIFMDWSGTAMDWDKSTVEKDIFVNNVMNNVHSGSIILIHEHPWSLANLDALLIKLEGEGYTYVDPKNIIE